MLESKRITDDRPALWRANRARKALLVLGLTVALLPFSCANQVTRKLHVTATAVAYGDTSVKPVSSTITTEAAEVVDTMWDEAEWRGWQSQVREVKAPDDIVAGEPLRVEVRAIDSHGLALSNARVEVTWILPGRQYRDWCDTGVFGDAYFSRTMGTACSGKPCVVAVTVTGDNEFACAYSSFKPK